MVFSGWIAFTPLIAKVAIVVPIVTVPIIKDMNNFTLLIKNGVKYRVIMLRE
jgi:hypothetical protein